MTNMCIALRRFSVVRSVNGMWREEMLSFFDEEVFSFFDEVVDEIAADGLEEEDLNIVDINVGRIKCRSMASL